MGLTNFPNGVSSFGIPVVGGIGIPSKVGKVYFVDATNGVDTNSGKSHAKAFQTIQKAINQCVSGAGDIVYIFPGTYNENLTITSKDYINLIGCVSPGYARPDVAPTTGIALSIANSQGTVLKHMRFVSADADTVVNEGNGFLFEDCVFDGDAGQAATEANLRLVGDAADDSYTASEGRIVDCLFRGCGGDALIFQHANAPSGVGVTNVEVLNCRFYDNTGDDIATAANTSGGGAGILLTALIHGCKFMTKDKAVYLDLDQASFAGGDLLLNTGMISGNFFNDDAALDATKIDISGTNLRFVGNYNAVGVVDGSTFDD